MKKLSHKKALLVPALLLGVLVSQVFSAQDPGLTLAAPTGTNNQVQFTLNCESGVSYVIERSADIQNWTPVLTNNDASIVRTITFDAPPGDLGFYRARRAPLPLFAGALTAVSTIDLKGNNLTTDSFDSADPNYSWNGLYPTANLSMTKAGGDVCTGGSFMDSLAVGNAGILGNLNIGPSGTNTVTIGSNGSAGDPSWVWGGHTGIQTGHLKTNFNVAFPDAVLPNTTWNLKVANNVTTNGVIYKYYFSPPGGDYWISSLGTNDNILITPGANVRLKITSAVNSGNSIIRIAQDNATLQIFEAGSSFTLSGASYVDNMSGHADRFFLYGLPNCTNVAFAGNVNLYGCIYAPQALFTIGGGGNNTYDVVGSIVAGSIWMNGHFNFHFDEHLKFIGPTR